MKDEKSHVVHDLEEGTRSGKVEILMVRQRLQLWISVFLIIILIYKKHVFVRLLSWDSHHLFKNIQELGHSQTKSQPDKVTEARVRTQVSEQGFPPSHHTHSTPCCWTWAVLGSAFSQLHPPPQVNLLTGQQMDCGGAQTTTPPAHCVCLCAPAWMTVCC